MHHHGDDMVRGNIPRQPSKAGRQDKAKTVRVATKPPKTTAKRLSQPKDGEAGPSARRLTPRSGSGQPAPAPLTPAKRLGVRHPAGGYNPLASERIAEILKRLDERYPNVTCALHHNSAWELLVATILSAQCTDVRVNLVTPVLFQKYPTEVDYVEAVAEELARDIQSTGSYRQTAQAIQRCCAALVQQHNGAVPDTMEARVELPGVGRKTANVVLGNAFGRPHGIAVDTHVQRLA